MIKSLAGFQQFKDRQRERLPVNCVRRHYICRRGKSGNSQNALLLNSKLRPYDRYLLDNRATNRNGNDGFPRRKESDFRAAPGLGELTFQLLLQLFPFSERQPAISQLLAKPLRNLVLGRNVGPDRKGVIKFTAIDVVLAEIELVVDDAEDRRIQKLVDGKESVIGVAAGFGRRKGELDLRYERSRRRQHCPCGDEYSDRRYNKNNGRN